MADSPLCSLASPTQATTTSAPAATATASSRSARAPRGSIVADSPNTFSRAAMSGSVTMSAPARVDHAPPGRREPRAHRHALGGARPHRPGALLVGAVVGERADQRDARAGPERQHAVVLQQDRRARHGLAGERPVRGGAAHRVAPPLVEAAVGVGEQPERELGAQHPAAGTVEGRLADLARGDQLRQVPKVGATRHVDVDAGREREPGRRAPVGRDAVGDELDDRVVVRDDQPVEAPALAQQPVEQLAVRRARQARQRMEADHDRADPRVHRRAERRAAPRRASGRD